MCLNMSVNIYFYMSHYMYIRMCVYMCVIIQGQTKNTHWLCGAILNFIDL